jgi:hypothetical protein
VDIYNMALRAFREHFAAFVPHASHLVPDIALRGFLHEMLENALIASSIAEGPIPHRAFPNVRSAFEAAQLALLLATSSDYDLDGARAWVYDLRKDRELQRSAEGLPESTDADASGYSPDERYEGAIKEMAEFWEDYARGKGHFMKRAQAIVEKQKRKPDNWAGVAIGVELARRLRLMAEQRGAETAVGNPDIALSGAYTVMCRFTHPRPSLRPLTFKRQSDDSVSIEYEKPDHENNRAMVATLAAGSLNFGTSALQLRVKMNVA